MKRRNFLKKTSAGFVVAALLPALSFSSTKTVISQRFGSTEDFTFEGKDYDFQFDVEEVLLKNFKDEEEWQKRFLIRYGEGGNPYQGVKYIAEQHQKKTVDGKDLNFITFKISDNQESSEILRFGKENLGKEIEIEIHERCHAYLRNKKNDLEIYFKYKSPDDADYDCFLTSACVHHKNLPDNCYELSSLRNLRDKIMLPNAQYSRLIREYKIVAPKMLLNINAASNKDEIMESIYVNLVLPSVCLIENDKNIEAIAHYRDFVEEMKMRYL